MIKDSVQLYEDEDNIKDIRIELRLSGAGLHSAPALLAVRNKRVMTAKTRH